MEAEADRLAVIEAKLGELRVSNAKLRRDVRDLTVGVFGCLACLSLIPGGIAVVGWISLVGVVMGLARFAGGRPHKRSVRAT